MAATVGKRMVSMRRGSSRRNCARVDSSPATVRSATSLMSAPAEKALSPSPVITRASTSLPCSRPRSVARHCSRIGRLIALRRAGSLNRSIAMRSSIASLTRGSPRRSGMDGLCEGGLYRLAAGVLRQRYAEFHAPGLLVVRQMGAAVLLDRLKVELLAFAHDNIGFHALSPFGVRNADDSGI